MSTIVLLSAMDPRLPTKMISRKTVHSRIKGVLLSTVIWATKNI